MEAATWLPLLTASAWQRLLFARLLGRRALQVDGLVRATASLLRKERSTESESLRKLLAREARSALGEAEAGSLSGWSGHALRELAVSPIAVRDRVAATPERRRSAAGLRRLGEKP